MGKRSLAAIFLLIRAASCPAYDLIDTGNLGPRGVTFEAPMIVEGVGGKILQAIGVGDVDGDGLGDLLFAYQAKADDLPGSYLALLVHGQPGLLGKQVIGSSTLPFRTANFRSRSPGTAHDPLPGELTAVGDLDGDGLTDFVIHYWYYSPDRDSTGLFLVRGSRSLEGSIDIEDVGSKVPGTAFHLSDQDQWEGFSCCAIGDFDGDGHGDLAIQTYFTSSAAIPSCRIYLILDASRLPPKADLADVAGSIRGSLIQGPVHPFISQIDGSTQYASFGVEIRRAGDVDGDGIDDFLASERDGPYGAWYIIHGRRNPPPMIDLGEIVDGEGMPGVTVLRRPVGLGIELGDAAGIGDLDGDGFSELLIGLPRYYLPHPGETTNSLVHLISGGPSLPGWIELSILPLPEASATIHTIQSMDGFGDTIIPLGDMNGDGIPDIAIGATRAPASGKTNAGAVYVLDGKRNFSGDVFLKKGFDGSLIQGERIDDFLGEQISPAGDFDGDGNPDFLVLASSPYDKEPSRAYLIYGLGDGSPPLWLQSVTPDHGRVRGGTEVIVRGSGFHGSPKILFGGRPAAKVTLVSESELRAVTAPSGVAERVDVTVSLDGVTRVLPGAFEFTRELPEIDLNTLGSRGFVLDGDPAAPWARAFTWPANAAFAAGDFDGDGRDEFVVQSSAPFGWLLTIVHGGPDLPSSLPAYEPSDRLTTIRVSSASGSGCTVATAGDMDGDGIQDLFIGSTVLEGILQGWILFGRKELSGDIAIEDEEVAGRAVRLVGATNAAAAGDIDGDGIADLAISTMENAVVFLAGRRSWSGPIDLSDPAAVLGKIRGPNLFGEEIVPAGDVDGDGLQDILVSTRGSPKQPGYAYLIRGRRSSPGDISIDALVDEEGGAVRIEIADVGSMDYLSIAAPGDVDGDGHPDLLIGCEGGGTDILQGITYLIRGGPALHGTIRLVEDPAEPDGIVRIFGEGGQMQAGRVGPAGDFDADGYADFLIGAPGFQDYGPGATFLVFGGPDLPARIDLAHPGGRALKISGRNVPGGAGFFTGYAGDLNGDGQPDFAFSEIASQAVAEDIDHVYVIFGPFAGVPFLRGDASFDGRLDITDAIFLISYLFLGGSGPLCEDAADADDSGTLDLTDAIRVLGRLFLDGPPLPAPYPFAGVDPTPDRLRCLGF